MKKLIPTFLCLLVIVFSVSCSKKVALNVQTFGPPNNPTEVHLFGNDKGFNQTDPMAPELVGGTGTYLGEQVEIRALLKFDLSSIPEDAEVKSAKLMLYSNPTPLNGQNGVANSGDDNTLLIQRITESWDSQTVSWQTQPESTEQGQLEIAHTTEPFLDLLTLDVTRLVSTMVSQGNYGFKIRLKNENPYNFRVFCSSKYSDKSLRPRLQVMFKK
jgi:hypothetical protein